MDRWKHCRGFCRDPLHRCPILALRVSRLQCSDPSGYPRASGLVAGTSCLPGFHQRLKRRRAIRQASSPANKLCKRQASRYRPHTPSRRRRPQQGPSSDRRRTAFVPVCRRRTRAVSAPAPCHPPMRTAAIRVRRSSMHRRSGTRWRQALWAVSRNRSLDLQLHCGLFSSIALDLILDGLSLIERA